MKAGYARYAGYAGYVRYEDREETDCHQTFWGVPSRI